MPREPLGDWCFPEGMFSLVESTVADGQQSCIPCDWYGNLPLVYFFPQQARNTLLAYVHYMRQDGAVPFTLGLGLNLVGTCQHDRQRTLNGSCFVDLVDRIWQRIGDDAVLREFYPAVKKSTEYVMNLVPGPNGIISTAGDQWYESMAWPGMSSHVGGVHLAHLRLAERMARKMNDQAFADQCHHWFEQGSQALEENLWANSRYLLFNDVSHGVAQKSDLVLAFQLDGQWIARFHGLEGVFESNRIEKALATIKRLNYPLTTAGLLDVVRPDGSITDQGGRMGGLSTMPASVFIAAMNYLYAGDRGSGLQIARDCLNEIVNVQGMTWDMPNIMIGTREHKQRVYGTDYYQCMSLWGLPAALAGQNLAQSVEPGSLIDRVIRAGKFQQPSRQ